MNNDFEKKFDSKQVFDFETVFNGEDDAFCIAPPDIEFILDRCSIDNITRVSGDGESSVYEATIVCGIGSIPVKCQDRVQGHRYSTRTIHVNLNQEFSVEITIEYADYLRLFESGLFLSDSCSWLLSEFESVTEIGREVYRLFLDVRDAVLEQAQWIFRNYMRC